MASKLPKYTLEKNRLGAPAFPEAPVYPIQATVNNSLNMFQADLRQPRVHSWSAGMQRAIGDNMALEVRYVGNKNMYASPGVSSTSVTVRWYSADTCDGPGAHERSMPRHATLSRFISGMSR